MEVKDLIANDYYSNMLISAINSNEVINFMVGKGVYNIECGVADVPTDFNIVMDAFFDLAKTNPEINVGEMFFSAIKEMLQGDELYIYCAVFLFFNYVIDYCRIKPDNYKSTDSNYIMSCQKSLKATFSIPIDEITLLMRVALNENKEKLKKHKKWTGANLENGIWDEIVRLNEILKIDYIIEII